MLINGRLHEIDNTTGFLHQVDAKPFIYDEKYNQKQGTTIEMAYLRLGVILANLSYESLKKASVLEIGPGSGVMFNVLKHHCKELQGYDIAPSAYSTLTLEKARERKWDGLIACDVIEHMPDINDLFKFNFDWAYISIPHPPNKIDVKWRHFKPDEHLWYATPLQIANWAKEKNYLTYWHGCPEDSIRKRWDDNQWNISSLFITKWGFMDDGNDELL